MTHDERLALIWKPFPIITRHTTSYPHGGTLTGATNDDYVIVNGKRIARPGHTGNNALKGFQVVNGRPLQSDMATKYEGVE